MAVVRKTVAVNLPTKVSEIVERCRMVVKGMTGNAYFLSPSLTLAVFAKDIDALVEANVNIKLSRSVVPIRDEALKKVMADMKRLVKYVQRIANANPDNAEVIINSSGFHIKRVAQGMPTNEYKVLSLETGGVILTAPTNKFKCPYIWEVSTNGTDWTILMVSRISAAQCETLTSGQFYYFRYRIVGQDNKPSMPSDVVSCMVK